MKQTAFIGWGLALALSAFGCGGNGQGSNTSDARTGQPPAAGAGGTAAAAGTAGSAANTNDQKSPITLMGCLQKGDGRSDYILTEVNTTQTAVGTSGSKGSTTDRSGSADAVGREQMRAASHAYRLNGERDNLEPLVGKQVRVSGTMTQPSDLNAHDANGKMKDRDRSKIDEGDLARVDVASIDSVADNCGAKNGRK